MNCKSNMELYNHINSYCEYCRYKHEYMFLKNLIPSRILNNLDGGKEQSYDEKHYLQGIIRKTENGTIVYYYTKNNLKVEDEDTLLRIRKLGLPPGWESVWISDDPESDIQAIGVDKSGRKQYKYHSKHVQKVNLEKFLRLYDFIKAIPKLDRRLRKHSKLPPYDKNKVLATIIKFIKLLNLRIGKEEYAKKHKSYGISSLRKKHVKFEDNKMIIKFKGKSNIKHSYTVKHQDLIAHVKLLFELEGDRLFQYLDDEKIRQIYPNEINEYIQVNMGEEFSAKDFRTYAANFYFIESLLKITRKQIPTNQKTIKKNISEAFTKAALKLGHKKSISKKSYVMDFCSELYSTDPEFFIDRKDKSTNDVLLDILEKFKSGIE